MPTSAILAGTHIDHRRKLIKTHIKNKMRVKLVREPKNKHDPNAVAAYIKVPILYGILGFRWAQIGYLQRARAKTYSKRMDSGGRFVAYVSSFYFEEDTFEPRVSI